MWLNIAVALLVLVTFFLASFVYARSQDNVNKSFAALGYTLTLWIPANYIGANFKTHYFARYFTHADFVLGTIAVLCFWFFTTVLLADADVPRRYTSWTRSFRLPYFVLAILTASITAFPFTVSIASQSKNHVYGIMYGPGYFIYASAFTVILLSGIANILLAIKYAKGVFRRQAITISRGLLVGAAFIAFANLAVPQLTSSETINLDAGNVSYLGIVIFIIYAAYAIIRHKLFDLRFFVVRVVAYFFSTIALSIFCLLPVAWLMSHVLHIKATPVALTLLVLLSLILTLAYQYLKGVFDKLTLRIFYRQYYEPQDVLDRLSDVLVRSIDIDWLQSQSKEILSTTLGVKDFSYLLLEGGHKALIVDVEYLFKDLGGQQSVLVLDEVNGHREILSRLRRKNIAAAVELRTTHGGLGYITLGFKESGRAYTEQDKRLLSTVADEIAISMQNALHFKEIQGFNITLQDRIDKATAQLRRSNQHLRRLDEIKDDFISMASHQLRTPLTSVKGYLSMVLDGDAGELNTQQRKLIEQSYWSSQQMVYLISDMLNLSRINTGKFVLEPAPIDLGTIVQDEVDQLQAVARMHKLKLIYKEPDAFPTLMLDDTKMHQVVMNFIDNAIHYTPSGGSVTVTLRETPTAVEYTVQDTGIGVPKPLQHRLFSKFYRAENAQRMRPDGTGLGLFMAKKVIVAQGGSVIFQSAEGKGSTFGFRLPKQPLLPQAAASPNTEAVVAKNTA